ncbi:hypothetical protein LX15_001160 [Streptoalloteichus tenebrarius]|uniref:Uncharacterized protein n=1 Tax=Streptoalloteichus tenebrarius (strain ATCC 17920 / DSM 40477 / JCM 4838 / CBS 697.72 / NBRC 16177 / NCIMB 11028 / NRRL B-12390 / A12253. 1 / ISP 5477) TaxID=1933 RepID=A0ABT1HPN7_STRSD|nr:hypothetical protein [Streptoalloteichus tenebrarius]MCP2257475.1 hypothetical protein [Streptoalloteichus tenebrarius]
MTPFSREVSLSVDCAPDCSSPDASAFVTGTVAECHAVVRR